MKVSEQVFIYIVFNSTLYILKKLLNSKYIGYIEINPPSNYMNVTREKYQTKI